LAGGGVLAWLGWSHALWPPMLTRPWEADRVSSFNTVHAVRDEGHQGVTSTIFIYTVLVVIYRCEGVGAGETLGRLTKVTGPMPRGVPCFSGSSSHQEGSRKRKDRSLSTWQAVRLRGRGVYPKLTFNRLFLEFNFHC
jgi:hypothetical protein